MSNSETKALHEISEKFMLGSLLKLMIGEIKLQSVPWGALPENEQQIVINRVTARCEKAIRETVQIIASKARPSVIANVESVMFKDGVKVTLTFPKSMSDRHAIADAAGDDVLLVLPQYDEVLQGDKPKADKNQSELI